jgi:hypothetical protein
MGRWRDQSGQSEVRGCSPGVSVEGAVAIARRQIVVQGPLRPLANAALTLGLLLGEREIHSLRLLSPARPQL